MNTYGCLFSQGGASICIHMGNMQGCLFSQVPVFTIHMGNMQGCLFSQGGAHIYHKYGHPGAHIYVKIGTRVCIFL